MPRPVEELPRLLVTREEAAAMLGMTLSSFKRHVQPHLKLVRNGQLVHVSMHELDRWVRQRET